jgi:hypothetical protein
MPYFTMRKSMAVAEPVEATDQTRCCHFKIPSWKQIPKGHTLFYSSVQHEEFPRCAKDNKAGN